MAEPLEKLLKQNFAKTLFRAVDFVPPLDCLQPHPKGEVILGKNDTLRGNSCLKALSR
jgi:hypothetical protein